MMCMHIQKRSMFFKQLLLTILCFYSFTKCGSESNNRRIQPGSYLVNEDTLYILFDIPSDQETRLDLKKRIQQFFLKSTIFSTVKNISIAIHGPPPTTDLETSKKNLFLSNMMALEIIPLIKKKAEEKNLVLDLLLVKEPFQSPQAFLYEENSSSTLDSFISSLYKALDVSFNEIHIKMGGNTSLYRLESFLKHVKIRPNGVLVLEGMRTLMLSNITPTVQWDNLYKVVCRRVLYLVLDNYSIVPKKENLFLELNSKISAKKIHLIKIYIVELNPYVLQEIVFDYKKYLDKGFTQVKKNMLNLSWVSNIKVSFDGIQKIMNQERNLCMIKRTLVNVVAFVSFLIEKDTPLSVSVSFDTLDIPKDYFNEFLSSIDIERFDGDLQIYRNLHFFKKRTEVFNMSPKKPFDKFFSQVPDRLLSIPYIFIIPLEELPALTQTEMLSALSERYKDYSFVTFLQKYAEKEENACLCSICYDSFAQEPEDDSTDTASNPGSLVLLPCTHVFHKVCFNIWVSKNKTCPYCRTPVTTEYDRRRIYIKKAPQAPQADTAEETQRPEYFLSGHNDPRRCVYIRLYSCSTS
ncbi:hypothetical protein NECID01_1836 [Nematocida sp. AWRm77]|nr:hypothetical protein NECID01_1836 [Nematocida sp. AWRm77]